MLLMVRTFVAPFNFISIEVKPSEGNAWGGRFLIENADSAQRFRYTFQPVKC